MTEIIARVHSVHFLNIEKRQAAADLQTKPPDYARFSQLSHTTTISIYRPTEGRRLSQRG